MFKCNRLVTAYKTEQEKILFYNEAIKYGACAVDENNTYHPLYAFVPDKVDFVARLWRVQREFNKPIQLVRGKEFVLLEKINKHEKNLFEYYTAEIVANNCYGKYLFGKPDSVVAKYDTDKGPLWAYGATLEQARAFLGIALFDENIEAIHAAERKTFQKSQ